MLPLQTIHCPYCGESIDLVIDDSVGDQAYIEDCQVCCRPIEVAVSIDADGAPMLSVRAEDDA